MLQMVAICPHPPIIVPEIGQDSLVKVSKTVKSMEVICKKIKEANPDLLVFITPHGPVFQDAITISHPASLKGSLKEFGLPWEIERPFAQDFAELLIENSKFIKAMVAELTEKEATSYGISLDLDHGILVPLYYLAKVGVDVPMVPINMGILPFEELYQFGVCLQETVIESNKNVVIIVSGDLSHRLAKDGPAGFDPEGKVFDEILSQALAEGDVLRILNLDHNLIEKAGECGLRPIIMGLGAFDGLTIESHVYSYEGPFGVGYLVGELVPGESCESRELLDKLYEAKKNRIKAVRERESWPVKWARENLEAYLKKGEQLVARDNIPPELARKAGVFVSLKKDGQLRGCIGTISPTTDTILKEIQANVLSAALHDSRFEPVEQDELDQLIYSVDILEQPEGISSIDQLDPRAYGVIVRKGAKQGLLLPMLEGIDTPEKQVTIAKEKAGIKHHEDVALERFKVTRYT